MEQKNNVLTAVIALVALVIGVFVGMGMNGGGGLQGKLSLTTEKGYKQCEEYKTLYVTGVISQTLGNEKATEVMLGCQAHFPAFWDARPTVGECNSLANRLYSAGGATFSDWIQKSKLSMSNLLYCASHYPYMWYGTNVSAVECYAYKSFMKSGGDFTKLLNSMKNNKNISDGCKQYWEMADDVPSKPKTPKPDSVPDKNPGGDSGSGSGGGTPSTPLPPQE